MTQIGENKHLLCLLPKFKAHDWLELRDDF